MCGDRGARWLNDLPSTIAFLESKWSVEVLAPFPGIEFNFVAPAVRGGSDQLVIKIAPPLEDRESYGEAKYLRTLAGHGVVRLIAENVATRSMLIERALPGRSLVEVFESDKPGSIGPAIDVMKSTLAPIPNDLTDVIMLDRWYDGLRRHISTDFPADYAQEALSLYDNVLRRSPNFYLHGDLHPANIVTAARSPYLAIDPKGIVGPVGYDIAVFLNNYHWWQDTLPDIKERLDNAVYRFSSAFGLSTTEVRQWAFAQMVLGAWWTFDEMPGLYVNEVAKADVWMRYSD